MLTVNDLRTEYAVNPLGIDTAQPCFSWVLSSVLRQTVQRSYRVLVASSPERLTPHQVDLWDSGVVESSRSIGIQYSGKPLQSGNRCFWSVRVCDNHGQTCDAGQPVWFELGLLDAADWQAAWINGGAGHTGRALLLRKGFVLDRPIARARAYATGLGYVELRLNGDKVGDHVLEPAWTAYDRRLLYTTYDITNQLRDGPNMLGAIVGHGWYGTPKLFVQLNITYADGDTACVCSGWGWQVAKSPILTDSIYDGEVHDARLEQPGWDLPRVENQSDDSGKGNWSQAMLTEGPGGALSPAMLEPIRVVETLSPHSIIQVRPKVWVVDFGQNFAGWVRIRPRGACGTRIHLRFAENVHDNGTVNRGSMRDAKAEDVYILSGRDDDQWEPRFTYHGFRYVEIEGWPGDLTAEHIDGRVVRSDVAKRGSFACDHPLINRIHEAVVRTEASNLHGVPTDCPQRDERMGWLNDITVRGEQAIHNFDLVRFYRKWLADIADVQDASGAIPDTVPYRYGNQPGDPVNVSYLLLPWLLYQHFGDEQTLRKHYAGMKAWVDCLCRQANDDVLEYSFWGDWAPPLHQKGKEVPENDCALNPGAPGELVSTGFLAYSARLLSWIAEVLGHQADQHAYSLRADRVAAAFNRRFWDPQSGGYGLNTQSCNALALYLGLTPADRVQSVVDNVAHDVLTLREGQLTTGNICTKFLPEVLTDHGHGSIAFSLASREAYPSWGYMLAHGATTIWERWENATGGGMNSHNHPMLGSIDAWFYRAIAGLRVDSIGPDRVRIIFRPAMVGDIKCAQASLVSTAGPVRVAWRRTERAIVMDIRVPVNGEATVWVPRLGDDQPEHVRVDDQIVWAQGMSIELSDLLACQQQPDHLCITVGSGQYTFTREFISDC